MLFAISGSQGSGKSTVLSALEELGYPTVQRKTSRSILDEWGVTLSQVNNDRELTIRFQDRILTRKMKDEAEAAADTSRIWFTERTYADLFTYAVVAIGKDNEYSDWLNEYFKDCCNAQNAYTHNFYLPGGLFPVQHDGVRGINKHYARMVDLVLQDTLIEMQKFSRSSSKEHVMLTTEVFGSSVNERVNFILGKISPYAPCVPFEVIEKEHDERFNTLRTPSS